MAKFNCEFIQPVLVTLDETKFTPEFMQEFRESFYDFWTIEQHAAHIAQLAARGLRDFSHNDFVEGYGVVGEMGISSVILNNSEISVESAH